VNNKKQKMITSTQSFKLYELFFPFVKSEEKTKEIIENIEAVIDNKFASEKDRLASKDDILQLKIEMKEQKSEIIKWMFLFWIGQIAVTLAVLYLKK
jgi:hypothetical protein